MLDTVEVTKLENLWKRRQRKRLALLSSLLVLFFVLLFILYLLFLSDGSSVETTNKTVGKNIVANNAITDKKEDIPLNQKKEVEYEEKKYISSPQDSEYVYKSDDLDDSKLKEKLQKAKDVKTLKEKAKTKEQNGVIVEEESNKKDKYISETDMSAYFADRGENATVVEEPLYRIESAESIDLQASAKPKKKIEITTSNEKSSISNPSSVKISTTNTKSDILLLENNFKSTGDSKYALELARVYYERKDFKNAAKWAFELNNLDKNDPNGWIIFSKAKYNNGEKSDAIKVLEAYKGRAANPDEIQALILQMQRNENIK